MVNSKKMRKSTVAIVLLSILLCLSMILTATGAWYTSSSKQDGQGGKVDFVMSDWMTLTVNAGATNTVKVTTSPKGVGSEDCATNEAGAYVVLPGDKVTFTQGAKATITANSKVAFYYIVSVDGGANWSEVTYSDAGDAIVLATEGNRAVTGAVDKFDIAGDVYTVKTSLNYGDVTGTFSLNFQGQGIQVKTIQANNLTAEAAKPLLEAIVIA